MIALNFIFIANDRRLTNVCQKAFMALHGIKSARLKRIRASACPESRQGKHNNRPNRPSAAAIEKVSHAIFTFSLASLVSFRVDC